MAAIRPRLLADGMGSDHQTSDVFAAFYSPRQITPADPQLGVKKEQRVDQVLSGNSRWSLPHQVTSSPRSCVVW